MGQDVGLAGVGDSWAGSMMEPGLATVRFYQKQVGQEAARILLQMLEENGIWRPGASGDAGVSGSGAWFSVMTEGKDDMDRRLIFLDIDGTLAAAG